MRVRQIQFYLPCRDCWGRMSTKLRSFPPLWPVWEQPLPALSSPVSLFLSIADWRLLLFSGVQHGGREPGHSVSPVWTLPCSTFLLPSTLLSHEHAAFKCTSLSLDCSHYTCWFLYLKLFPRLLLALHPLSQRQDCLTEAFADWPCQLLYPILCYHDSRWQIKFSEDGHRNVSHHTCSSDYVTLQLLPLSGGRSVSAS